MVYYAHSKSMKENNKHKAVVLPLLGSDDLLVHLLGVATCIYIYTIYIYIIHITSDPDIRTWIHTVTILKICGTAIMNMHIHGPSKTSSCRQVLLPVCISCPILAWFCDEVYGSAG